MKIAVAAALLSLLPAPELVPNQAPAEPDAPISVVDDRVYPGADEILVQHGVRLLAGDGNIRFAPVCSADPGQFRVEQLNGSQIKAYCFDVLGAYGYVMLAIDNVFLVRGADHSVTATATYNGQTETVEVPPATYQPIGGGNGTHTLVELRVSGGAAAPGESSAYPFVARVDMADGRGCSGVLVAPAWIATTRTCLKPQGDFPAGTPPQAAFVTVGRADLARGGGHSTTIAEVVPRTDRDLVLARLAAPAAGIVPVGPPMGVLPPADWELTGAGYSRIDDWTSNRMRAGKYVIASSTATTFTMTRAAGNPASTCKGDAGGPYFRALDDGRTELIGLHVASWHNGCQGAAETGTDAATEVRADGLGDWFTKVTQAPPLRNPLGNLFADATVVARTSLETGGWGLANVNDGVREGIGYSSAGAAGESAYEQVEFSFPDGAARTVTRIDLYPRTDVGNAGVNFPSQAFVEEFTSGGHWRQVGGVRLNGPLGNRPVKIRLQFTATTTKLRVRSGVAGQVMQLAEVEAYRSDNLIAAGTVTTSSSVENASWSHRFANDGRREGLGWSSSETPSPSRPEWIEFSVPGSMPGVRPEPGFTPKPAIVNRVDLYPRSDSDAGRFFPSDFTIDVYRDGAWHTVVTRTGLTNPGRTPQRLYFPAQAAERLRLNAPANKVIQLAEVEAYQSDSMLADATVTASSSQERPGFSKYYVNDGSTSSPGWSSADPPVTGRVEWIEFGLNGGPRTVNVVDIYPRDDGGNAGLGFPPVLRIEVFRDGAWHTALRRTGIANPGRTAQRFWFPAQVAERIRVSSDAGHMMQFAEITANNL
jgi:hypothetical protein